MVRVVDFSMTTTTEWEAAEVYKRDKMGRVRVSRERREELLDEYERGGSSGAQFASDGPLR
jgi:hypothetical protein